MEITRQILGFDLTENFQQAAISISVVH